VVIERYNQPVDTRIDLSVEKIWKNSGGSTMSKYPEDVQVKVTLMRVESAPSTGTLSFVGYDPNSAQPIASRSTYDMGPYPVGTRVKVAIQTGENLFNEGVITGLGAEDTLENGTYNGTGVTWLTVVVEPGNKTLEFRTNFQYLKSRVVAVWAELISPDDSYWKDSLLIEEPETTAGDGAEEQGTVYDTVTLPYKGSWNYTWSKLKTQGTGGESYSYYLEEAQVSTDGGKTWVTPEEAGYASEVTDNGDHTYTITNTSTKDQGYTLPATGSQGPEPLYAIGIALLILGGTLGYTLHKRQRRRGEGR
jgi:LPXTG-motif cell wall-anchored protein